VKKGDTLPLMCYRIYGDSRYYLQVAMANRLTNFRNLQVGDELFFPPIEKTSNT
jgi:nucleoid-associated protein YgaU